jgi:hypothetical protein
MDLCSKFRLLLKDTQPLPQPSHLPTNIASGEVFDPRIPIPVTVTV